MKKFLNFFAAALALVGCTKYELNTNFSMPDELVSPSGEIALDVTSSKTVTLSWNGGGAEDGGLVLYNVLFDKEGGDFSNPIETMQSDLGARSELTLSHAQINTLARKAGVKPMSKGRLIWTVQGAKGGVMKTSDLVGSLRFERGEGIDNIPSSLYIQGSAAKEAGQQFAGYDYMDGDKVKSQEGKFVIYTELGEGSLFFSSEKDGSGFRQYIDESGKLREGEGVLQIEAAPATGLARITVDFNTLSYKIDEIGKNVLFAWGATKTSIATLEYQGNGIFVGDGDVDFYGPGTNMEDNPDWCSWVEERYYFLAEVNGEEMCWGSGFGSGAWTPDGTDEFWYVFENRYEQWNNLWKMDHSLDDMHVTFTLNTNHNGHFVHSMVGGAIQYDQPSATPSTLIMKGGEAAEQQMRKEGDSFVIYNRFEAGKISFVDDNGTKYFADADGKLFIGNPKTSVEASDPITRVTVNFAEKTVKFDKIGDKVWVENAWDHIVMAELSYQSLGRWAGEGEIKFAANGDERYSLRTTVNGVNMRWGSNKGNDGTAPDGTEEFWYLYESEWEGQQWNNLYKFNKEDMDKTAVFVVEGNDPVHMRHSITVKSSDPVPPSMAPESLTLHGTGAESDGQEFRLESAGVFVAYARLSEGTLFFRSGSKNYFFDAEKGLLEGEGEGITIASAAETVSRITVNFTTNTVTTEAIGEYAHLKFAADYRDLAHLKYQGNGIWKAENFKVDFIDPSKPDTNPPSWLSWLEERYYFIIEVDGTEKCWGRLDSVTGNDLKPNDDPNFYHINEFNWTQWDHLWKFAPEMNGANVSVEINTNNNGVWEHTITKL